MAILSIKKLSKNYGAIRALNQVSFDVPPKTVFGILGPNGSGKTTLLGIVMDILKATEGTYEWNGESSSPAIRKKIGTLLETPNFYHYLSAIENLRIAARIKGADENDIPRILEIVNLLQGARDPWFRPSDVKIAPDGSLIVADWYDPGVGGHAMGDLNRGRIFRVTAKGQSGKYQMPKFDFTTASGAVAALQNPNLATRYLAWTALHQLGTAAEPELIKLSQSDSPVARARALWLLGKIPGRGLHYVETATLDRDPRIRMLGIRLARQLSDVDELTIAARLARDPSPQVRRECALAVRHQRDARGAEIWAILAAHHDGHDRW